MGSRPKLIKAADATKVPTRKQVPTLLQHLPTGEGAMLWPALLAPLGNLQNLDVPRSEVVEVPY
jgi:hypothetical protein